ncbi:MAG: glycosyltransferase [Verrucomicrobiae bacterium]|nr:glycosyltransferase [Verrucomicrobiae bacterium]
MRVVLLTNMLPPYRVEFFNELSRLCDLVVVADSLVIPTRSWEVDPSEFKFTCVIARSKSFLRELKRRDLGFKEVRELSLGTKTIPLLCQYKPDVVITCEFGLRTLQTMLYARWKRIPFVVWSEGTHLTEKKIGLLRRFMRWWVLRHAARAWADGKLNIEYLTSWGFDPARVDVGMTGVSTELFRDRVGALLAEREAIRQRLGLNGLVFIFSGVFSRRKGIHLLLDALTRAAPRLAGKASVLFVGDGELRPLIEQWKAAHPEIPVHVTGFVQQPDLFQYYAAGDVFVLPTVDDNWPLATLEALVAGLPQIFSTLNGATPDLLSAQTGVACNPFDADAFASALVGALDWGRKRLPSDVVARFCDYYSPRRQAERAFACVEKAYRRNATAA